MSNDPNRTPTRREAMSRLGAGLATAPLVLASANGEAQPQTQSQQSPGAARRESIRDPREALPQAAVSRTTATLAGFGREHESQTRPR